MGQVLIDAPPVGMHRTSDHKYFWRGAPPQAQEGPYPSVTTAIGVLDKPAIVPWAKNTTAAFAIRNLDTLLAHRDHATIDPNCVPCAKAFRPYDRDYAAARWVASIPDYKRDEAADLGTEIHRIAEEIGRGEAPDVTPAFIPYADQYRRALDIFRPKLLAVEYMGLNRTHNYAGTGDILWDIDGMVTAVDIKSHTKPTPVPYTYYPETALQLIACSRFDFIGKPDDPTEYPMPRVDAYAVLLIGRDDFRLIRYFPTEATFDAFLACLEVLRWHKGEGRRVVGQHVEVPKEETAA